MSIRNGIGNRETGILGVVFDAPPRATPEDPRSRRERQQAVRDLLEDGSFGPHGLIGPFVLRLSFRQHRIAFDVRDRGGTCLREFMIPLGRLRPAIADYRMIVEAHLGSIEHGVIARIQAIDLTRRSIHDEAAATLIDVLREEAVVDHRTARRLFTLIYAVEIGA